MSDSDQAEQIIDDGKRPAGGALVPLVASAQWSRIPDQLFSRPDSIFVAHLIATAGHAPQTRSLRRAAPAEAQTAYTTPRAQPRSGVQMRRTI